MFETKKQIKELDKKLKEFEIRKKELETLKEELQKEKEELLKLKEIMENQNSNNPDRIDISDVYIWFNNGIKYFVRLEEKKEQGLDIMKRTVDGYKSTLTDVFSGKILYKQFQTIPLKSPLVMKDIDGDLYDTILQPICEKKRSLLIYVDKRVPRYILQKYYYEANCLNISDIEIEKTKQK